MFDVMLNLFAQGFPQENKKSERKRDQVPVTQCGQVIRVYGIQSRSFELGLN